MKKSLLNVFILSGSNLVSGVLSMLQSIIVARAIGVRGLGEFGVVTAFCALIQGFLGFRTSEALTTYLVEYRHGGKSEKLKILLASTLSIDLLTRMAAFGITIFFASVLPARYLPLQAPSEYYYLAALTLLFNFVEPTWFAVLRDAKRYSLISWINISYSAAQLGVIALLYFFGMVNLHLLFVVLCSLSFIKCLIQIFSYSSEQGKLYGLYWGSLRFDRVYRDRDGLADFWSFMRAGYASSLISSFVKGGDILLLGYLATAYDAGLYRIAKSLVGILQIITNNLSTVYYQDMNELLMTSTPQSVLTTMERGSLYLAAAALIALGLSLSFARFVIITLYGSAFADSDLPLVILICGYLVSFVLFWAQPMLLALRKYRASFYIVASTGAWFASSSFLFIPRIGATGAAISMAGAWAIGYILCYLNILRTVKAA